MRPRFLRIGTLYHRTQCGRSLTLVISWQNACRITKVICIAPARGPDASATVTVTPNLTISLLLLCKLQVNTYIVEYGFITEIYDTGGHEVNRLQCWFFQIIAQKYHFVCSKKYFENCYVINGEGYKTDWLSNLMINLTYFNILIV